jgi:hypothetical protein
MEKRREKRLHTKLYVNLKAGMMTAGGLLCDVSENGLFIQCTRDFTIGAVIDIEIFMPDNTDSLVKGIVRRKIEMPETYRKHGIGIEIIEKDMRYTIFVRSVSKTPAGENVNAAG